VTTTRGSGPKRTEKNKRNLKEVTALFKMTGERSEVGRAEENKKRKKGTQKDKGRSQKKGWGGSRRQNVQHGN